MITIKYRGRLGNNMIQYAAGWLLAKKTGLFLTTKPIVKYENVGRLKTTSSDKSCIVTDFGKVFNIKEIGNYSFTDMVDIDDDNYIEHLTSSREKVGYHLDGFFQDHRLLCDYRGEILDLYQHNKKSEIDISPDDVFVACRFGDSLVTSRTFCTVEYVESQLKMNRQNFRNIYLTSDSLDYPPLVKLIDKYNITPYSNDPLETILFAKNFNNLILSAGSFSYWMSYLSEANNITVYNNKHDPLQRQNAWNYNKNVQFNL